MDDKENPTLGRNTAITHSQCGTCKHKDNPCIRCNRHSEWEDEMKDMKKKCNNCKYSLLPFNVEPCWSCNGDNMLWEPIEEKEMILPESKLLEMENIDNRTVAVLMNMPVLPDGWEYTGEYRIAKENEITANPFEKEHNMIKKVETYETAGRMPIVKKKRWRAERHQDYEYITQLGLVMTSTETADAEDILRYNAGNYYKPGLDSTKEKAEKIKQILKG